MWRWFLGVAALPSAMVAVAYRVLPESPRFLQVMGRHEEAMQVSAVCCGAMWGCRDVLRRFGAGGGLMLSS